MQILKVKFYCFELEMVDLLFQDIIYFLGPEKNGVLIIEEVLILWEIRHVDG